MSDHGHRRSRTPPPATGRLGPGRGRVAEHGGRGGGFRRGAGGTPPGAPGTAAGAGARRVRRLPQARGRVPPQGRGRRGRPVAWFLGRHGARFGRQRRAASLAELERQVAERRDGPAYGQDSLISCDRLVRIFTADGVEVQALQGLDLLVGKGELMALVGASGSGKSTLLNILAGLDVPTAGAASVGGYDLLRHGRRGPAALPPRGRRLHLAADLPQPAAVSDRRPERRLPMQLSGRGGPRHAAARRPRRRTARHRSASRTAATGDPARCPAASSSGPPSPSRWPTTRPLLADEPTGELDSATAEQVFGAFRTANEQLGTTVVVVTHDQSVADAVHRTVAIRDGRTASEVVRRTEIDEHGQESVVAREYATVDRAGRAPAPPRLRRGPGHPPPRPAGTPAGPHHRPP